MECFLITGYIAVLPSCEVLLDLLPASDDTLRFGNSGQAGVDVRLPARYTERK